MLSELITGYITMKEGSAVAQQFEDTFSGMESFDEQNDEALKLIKNHCFTILKSSPFEDPTPLRDYCDAIDHYIRKTFKNQQS